MLVIGVDVGTTGTKSAVFDENGAMLSAAYKEYPLKSEGGRVTQNANDWWNAVVYTVRCAAADCGRAGEIAAMSLSTQGASMLCIDGQGEPLSEVITWMDTRAAKEAELLAEEIGAEKIYGKCGWQISPVLDAAKLLWLRRNEPDIFSRAESFVSTLEFINIHLTGNNVIDPTNAAIRQLFDIKSADWDSEILSAVGVTRDMLPHIMPVGAEVGRLTRTAAEALGLSTEVKVFNGAHDQYCASLGCGAMECGDMLLATGTTWVVLGITDKPMFTASHISPGIHPAGMYGAMASIVSAGSALGWYKNIISDNFKIMDAEASTRALGAKNLFVLPYVAGAGFPHGRPELRGAMFGLDAGHDRYHIARAVMEGVAFEAAGVLDEFARQGMKIDKLMMSGGAAKSRVWSEIVGYVTGCRIYRATEPEACCVGAAMTAAVGCGMFADYRSCREKMVGRELLQLDCPEMLDFYAEKRSKYNKLVSALMSV